MSELPLYSGTGKIRGAALARAPADTLLFSELGTNKTVQTGYPLPRARNLLSRSRLSPTSLDFSGRHALCVWSQTVNVHLPRRSCPRDSQARNSPPLSRIRTAPVSLPAKSCPAPPLPPTSVFSTAVVSREKMRLSECSRFSAPPRDADISPDSASHSLTCHAARARGAHTPHTSASRYGELLCSD